MWIRPSCTASTPFVGLALVIWPRERQSTPAEPGVAGYGDAA
jgi:hypothetical protein